MRYGASTDFIKPFSRIRLIDTRRGVRHLTPIANQRRWEPMFTSNRILVVEDEADLSDIIAFNLQRASPWRTENALIWSFLI